MENIVKKLFEAGLLSESDQKTLQESFDARVSDALTEAREQAVAQVRQEMSERFEHDKSNLVEAVDRLLTDVVQKYESGRADEVAKLREAKERFNSATTEMKQAYRTRMQEHAKVLETFVMNKLSSELTEFNEDKNAVAGMRLKLAATLAENKEANKARLKEHMSLMRKFVVEKLDGELQSLRKQQTALSEQKIELETQVASDRQKMQENYAARLATIDKFVVKKIAEELQEFQADKRALVEKKVELVAEARAKLAETQRNFVTKAAKLVDVKVTEALKSELTQLHEDLERNRQNMLGRRIFEAMAAEYASSYLSEGTETKRLEKVLAEQASKLQAAEQKLNEARQATDAANRKTRVAEEAAIRTKTMSELLSPLTREKQAVMQELLGSVKTTQLREAFNKYLPAVLNEGGKKNAPQSRQTLSEAPKEKRTVSVTGDQRNNRLLETVQAEDSEVVSTETATILKLAGIQIK
jgi:hypothetical protein